MGEGERVENALLREGLRRTWYPFFGRFGRLTATQRVAMPPLLEGADLLLVAPTATGKTEAVCAPLIERHVPPLRGPSRLRMVVVAPTRALCNDLERRLRPPLDAIGLALACKHTDAPALRVDRPPDVLITTPESLDSLCARHAELLQEVAAVFVDEAHLLLPTERGDQLLHVLERLARRRERSGPVAPLQRCAASASVGDPAAMARRVCGVGARVVEVAGPEVRARPIRLTLHDAPRIVDAVARLRAARERHPDRKRLLFVNRRRDAEEVASLLRDEQVVLVHHGSLSTEERLRSERRLRQAPSALCVATSTLEIGVDIGDVDEAWLLGPPPDVAAFLQRVGRANRRGDVIRAVGLVATEEQRLRMEHLHVCAEAGRLHEELPPPRPAVIAQQALSLCLQHRARRIAAAPLHERISQEAAALWNQRDCEAILRGLEQEGWLERAGRVWTLGEKAERDGGRSLHAAFSATKGMAVRDDLSGRIVGEVLPTWARSLARGSRFTLGGQGRQVVRQEENVLVVEGRGRGEAGRFLFTRPPSLSRALAADFKQWLGVPAEEVSIHREEKGLALVHWNGAIRGVLLAAVLRQLGCGTFRVEGDFRLRRTGKARGPLPERLGSAAELQQRLEHLPESAIEQIERALSPGRFVECVPTALRRRWVELALDLEGEARWLASLRLVDAEAQA